LNPLTFYSVPRKQMAGRCAAESRTRQRSSSARLSPCGLSALSTTAFRLRPRGRAGVAVANRRRSGPRGVLHSAAPILLASRGYRFGNSFGVASLGGAVYLGNRPLCESVPLTGHIVEQRRMAQIRGCGPTCVLASDFDSARRQRVDDLARRGALSCPAQIVRSSFHDHRCVGPGHVAAELRRSSRRGGWR